MSSSGPTERVKHVLSSPRHVSESPVGRLCLTLLGAVFYWHWEQDCRLITHYCDITSEALDRGSKTRDGASGLIYLHVHVQGQLGLN